MLNQCDAYGFIYANDGTPAVNRLVTLKRVEDASGHAITLDEDTTYTDSAGIFRFTLPQNATVYVSARASTLWNCPSGVPMKVPAAASGELLTLAFPPDYIQVLPPLVYADGVLSIPQASETQDGYLSAADYLAFLTGDEMGVVSFNARTGEVVLLSNDISAALGYTPLGATIPGVAGTWNNPSRIVVNSKGQIISITSGAPDTTPPAITLDPVSDIAATSVTINWTTDEPADSLVEYGLDTGYGSSSTLDSSPVTDHAVTLSALLPETPYHYRVKSVDTAGNLQTSADASFTTAVAPDTTPPVITIQPVTAITATSAMINWTTDGLADSKVDYGPSIPYAFSTTLDPALVTDHHVALSSLAALTLYHYRVISKDAIGNPRTSLDATFTTAAGPDITPPVITLDPVTAIGATHATINWTTNEPADSLVEYDSLTGAHPPYSNTTPLTDAPASSAGVTTHAVTLGGLAAATPYHYRVKSKDAIGNPQTSADDTFTTAAASGVDLMTGLVSYWKLEEATGTRFDAYGPNHFSPVDGGNGLPTNGPGKIGQCVTLPQVLHPEGSYLTCPDDPSQRMTGDFAITSWIFIHGMGFYDSLPSTLSMWASDNLGFCILFNSLTWVWQFSVSGDGATQTDCDIPGPATTKEAKAGPDPLSGWHFMCAQYEAATGTMSLSIDDGPVTTQFAGFTGQIFQSTAPLQIGAFDIYYRTFASIDEIAWYARKLSPAEVTALAAAPTYPFA